MKLINLILLGILCCLIRGDLTPGEQQVFSIENSTLCDQPDVFHCDDDNFQCVPMSAKCDGSVDCSNRLDEAVVTCGCLPSEFQCNSTTCISKLLQCDRKNDCENGLDENNCKAYVCPVSHIKCENDFCYPRDKQCDFVDDCGDNSDEKYCDRRVCSGTYFKCNNSQCIHDNLVCDGYYDCKDHSDEREDLCLSDNPNYFRCATGVLVKQSYACDGVFVDCYLTEDDENNCGECGAGQFNCSKQNKCIQTSNVCDGHCDCLDCSDEDDCATSTFGCPSDTKFVCKDRDYQIRGIGKRCVHRENFCDLKNDCLDTGIGYDELNCLINGSVCSGEQFFCSRDKSCLYSKRKCDNYPDCSDGEDESQCPDRVIPPCESGHFQCVATGDCIPLANRCNAVHDCFDWSDELNCENFTCPPNKTKCNSGHCINQDYWCDFYRDCPDGSDEKSCTAPRPCNDDEFRCNSGQCINASQVCFKDSNRRGCADNSHIINCTSHNCSGNQFKCHNSYCIDGVKVCDGKLDCVLGGWDEENCMFLCPSKTEQCLCEGNMMNCVKRNLTEVPELLKNEDLSKVLFSGNKLNLTEATFSSTAFDRVTYLDLSSNDIFDIPDRSFQNMWRLAYLNLADNSISQLKNGSLIGLTQLVTLNLNGNRISDIEEDVFANLTKLKSLDLSGQNLTHLYKNMFKGLKEVTVLNLTRNKIKYIENGAFNGLHNIHTIDLTHNKIRKIGDNVFKGLPTLSELKTDSFTFCYLAPKGVDCSPKQDECDKIIQAVRKGDERSFIDLKSLMGISLNLSSEIYDGLLASLQANWTQLKVELRALSRLCFYPPYVYNDNKYLISRFPHKNVTDAQLYCTALGGYLAEIDDVNEYQTMKSYLACSPADLVVVGGSYDGIEGQWVYPRTGGPVPFLDWAPEQPDNLGAEGCLSIWNKYEGTMNNITCGFRSDDDRFMCEIPNNF